MAHASGLHYRRRLGGDPAVWGYTHARFVLVPLFVIALGESNYASLSWVRRYGDISYGVYIWGWPLQQALVQVLDPTQPVLAVLSILLSWGVGALSWHLLEKRALRLKLRVAPARESAAALPSPNFKGTASLAPAARTNYPLPTPSST